MVKSIMARMALEDFVHLNANSNSTNYHLNRIYVNFVVQVFHLELNSVHMLEFAKRILSILKD